MKLWCCLVMKAECSLFQFEKRSQLWRNWNRNRDNNYVLEAVKECLSACNNGNNFCRCDKCQKRSIILYDLHSKLKATFGVCQLSISAWHQDTAIKIWCLFYELVIGLHYHALHDWLKTQHSKPIKVNQSSRLGLMLFPSLAPTKSSSCLAFRAV